MKAARAPLRNDWELVCSLCGRGGFVHLSDAEARGGRARVCPRTHCGGTVWLTPVPSKLGPNKPDQKPDTTTAQIRLRRRRGSVADGTAA